MPIKQSYNRSINKYACIIGVNLTYLLVLAFHFSPHFIVFQVSVGYQYLSAKYKKLSCSDIVNKEEKQSGYSSNVQGFILR